MFTNTTTQAIEDLANECWADIAKAQKAADNKPLITEKDGTPQFLNSDGTIDRDAEAYYIYLLKKEEIKIKVSLALAEHRFNNFRGNTIVNPLTIRNEFFNADAIPNEYEKAEYRELLTTAFNAYKMEESRDRHEESLRNEKTNFSMK